MTIAWDATGLPHKKTEILSTEQVLYDPDLKRFYPQKDISHLTWLVWFASYCRIESCVNSTVFLLHGTCFEYLKRNKIRKKKLNLFYFQISIYLDFECLRWRFHISKFDSKYHSSDESKRLKYFLNRIKLQKKKKEKKTFQKIPCRQFLMETKLLLTRLGLMNTCCQKEWPR